MRNKEMYHEDWKDIIRPQILKDRKYKCEKCGIKHKDKGYRDYKKEWISCDEFMVNWAKGNNFKLVTQYLNVHHKNGNRLDNSENNLMVLCFSCHFKIELELRKLKRLIKKM